VWLPLSAVQAMSGSAKKPSVWASAAEAVKRQSGSAGDAIKQRTADMKMPTASGTKAAFASTVGAASAAAAAKRDDLKKKVADHKTRRESKANLMAGADTDAGESDFDSITPAPGAGAGASAPSDPRTSRQSTSDKIVYAAVSRNQVNICEVQHPDCPADAIDVSRRLIAKKDDVCIQEMKKGPYRSMKFPVHDTGGVTSFVVSYGVNTSQVEARQFIEKIGLLLQPLHTSDAWIAGSTEELCKWNQTTIGPILTQQVHMVCSQGGRGTAVTAGPTAELSCPVRIMTRCLANPGACAHSAFHCARCTRNT
jgi:hypothetical protein